jgi:hypothetical protein
VLRAWVEFTCDQLTGCFHGIQAGDPSIVLGNMVMYLGAEKAGIRLADYHDVPLRVGELMFDDGSFDPPKGKTNELFSALFHRRYVLPELAFSETTAYPADRLSARNMAAKLVVSTLTDVRHTMFMSGITPFPLTHWEVLGPAMKEQARLHERLAGHRPAGPFKHYWGEGARYVGDDNPYSLFLAAGVPFEVIEAPGEDGWVFLCDADKKEVEAGRLRSKGAVFVCREASNPLLDGVSVVPEDLTSLFALKRELSDQLREIPYVVEEKPVVCSWYPTARAVLLWNLSKTHETFTLRLEAVDRAVDVPGLGTVLVEDVGA